MGRETPPPTNDNTDTVRELALREARTPSSQSVRIKKGLRLDCGAMLPELVMAYEQYGELNEERTNAILVCQALTCLLYTSPSPRDQRGSRMPSSA